MIVLVILYNRPEYTTKCLEYLAKSKGIDNYKILFQVDYYNQEVINQAQAWNKCPSTIVVNNEHLGCNGNTYAGLTRAFNEDDAVAVIEDDILISSDWFNFVSRPEFRDSFAICTFRKTRVKPIFTPDRYLRTDKFCSWGCVIWRDSWEKIKMLWADEAWDRKINNSGIIHKGSIIQPVIGRSINIGALGGTYMNYKAWANQCYTPYWYENVK